MTNRLQVDIDFSQKKADFCLLFPDGRHLIWFFSLCLILQFLFEFIPSSPRNREKRADLCSLALLKREFAQCDV